MALCIEILTRSEQLATLRPEWHALWRRVASATPFQSPAWLLPWWRRFGNGRLRTLVVRDQDRLLAVLPLFHDTSGVLRFVGHGDANIQHALVAPEAEAALPTLVRDALAHLPDDWTACELLGLPEDSWLLRDPSTLPPGLPPDMEVEPVGAIGILELGPGGLTDGPQQEFETAQEIARAERNLRIVGLDDTNRDRLLSLTLHPDRVRWASAAEGRMYANPEQRAFHHEVAAGFAALGALRLYVVYLVDRPVAVHYGFVANGQGFAYATLVDRHFAYYRPDMLALGHAVNAAAGDGARRFQILHPIPDCIRGWGMQERRTCRVVLRRRTVAAA